MAFTDFQEAIVTSDDHVVMGKTLRPFCLEYQFWLEVIESPLLTGEKVTVVDVEIAALVCSAGYRENKSLPRNQKNYVGLLKKLGWCVRAVRTNLSQELANFDRYIRDYSSMPQTHDSGAPGGKNFQTFPNVLNVASALIDFGVEGGRLEPIWMMPLGEAHWYTIAYYRLRGSNVGLKTEHDRVFESSHEEFMRQYKAMQESGAFEAAEQAEAKEAAAAGEVKSYAELLAEEGKSE